MPADDFVEHIAHVTIPGEQGHAAYGIRPRSRIYREGEAVITLLLRRRDTGGIFSRVTFAVGNSPAHVKEEKAARAFMERQDSLWWYNAPWLIGDGLEIVEA